MGVGIFQTMGPEGDTKVMWDSDKPVEVDAARAQFDALMKQGYVAYEVDKKGDAIENRKVRRFDPKLERLILTPEAQPG